MQIGLQMQTLNKTNTADIEFISIESTNTHGLFSWIRSSGLSALQRNSQHQEGL